MKASLQLGLGDTLHCVVELASQSKAERFHTSTVVDGPVGGGRTAKAKARVFIVELNMVDETPQPRMVGDLVTRGNNAADAYQTTQSYFEYSNLQKICTFGWISICI